MSIHPDNKHLIEAFMGGSWGYFGDWNSLMSVISKIFDIPGGKYESEIRRQFWGHIKPIQYHIHQVEFKESEDSVILFIKWHNSIKPTHETLPVH